MEDEAVKQHQRRKLVTPDDRRQVKCGVCGRSFRRESDKARHKCKSEREKPVSEQRGSEVRRERFYAKTKVHTAFVWAFLGF